MERTCKKCGEIKPIEEFVKDSRSKRYTCKHCRNKYKAKCDSTPEQQRRIKEYRLLNRAKMAEYHKRKYLEDREEIIQRTRAWYENNKDRAYKRSRIYIENNKEHVRIMINKNVKKHVMNIADSYVKRKLNQLYGLEYTQIPQDLIELYRANLKLKRLIKNNENEECNRLEKRPA